MESRCNRTRHITAKRIGVSRQRQIVQCVSILCRSIRDRHSIGNRKPKRQRRILTCDRWVWPKSKTVHLKRRLPNSTIGNCSVGSHQRSKTSDHYATEKCHLRLVYLRRTFFVNREHFGQSPTSGEQGQMLASLRCLRVFILTFYLRRERAQMIYKNNA